MNATANAVHIRTHPYVLPRILLLPNSRTFKRNLSVCPMRADEEITKVAGNIGRMVVCQGNIVCDIFDLRLGIILFRSAACRLFLTSPERGSK